MSNQFEVLSYEGFGRFGLIKDKDNSIFTPSIVDTKVLNTIDNLQTVTPKFAEIAHDITIHIPDSFQSQNIDINKVSSVDEIFKDVSKEEKEDFRSYYQLPLDTSLIYLNKFEKYLENIYRILKNHHSMKGKIGINFPYTKDLELNEPHIFSDDLIDFVTIGDIGALLTNPRALIEYFKTIRKFINPQTLIFAPGIPPSYIPILTYLGVDLFDLNFEIQYPYTKYKEINNVLEPLRDDKFNVGNYYKSMIAQIVRSIQTNKLRDLVRIYSHSDPSLHAIFRLTESIEELYTLNSAISNYRVNCTDNTDLYRPEVSLFRTRVKSRFSPPENVKGIIFLPCSAKKPYSISKSHNMFINTLKRGLGSKYRFLYEYIVTSPLGIVPRDLEWTFPAGHYDIPVTGDWSNKEITLMKTDIKNIIEKTDKEIQLLGHVNKTEKNVLLDVCNELNRNIEFSKIVGSPTSSESLSSLFRMMREFSSQIEKEKIYMNPKLRFLRSVADYQFGKDVGKHLLPDYVEVRGRIHYGLKLSIDKKHYMYFNPHTGFLSNSLESAKILHSLKKYWVQFDGTKIEGSTIFMNAISKCDKEIRANDEVILLDSSEKIIGIGRAKFSSKILTTMKNGKGVLLRKKF